jgi:hypothetical protein
MNKILHKVVVPTLLIASTNVQAYNAYENEILLPITNIFSAMRENNGSKLLAQFTNKARLERATKDNKIEISNLEKFAKFVDTSDKYLDEKLLSIHVEQSDNVASVWTPFAFYLGGKLSHCGINSFQLVKQNNLWKIHYLIDNAHQGDCEAFITKYKMK